MGLQPVWQLYAPDFVGKVAQPSRHVLNLLTHCAESIGQRLDFVGEPSHRFANFFLDQGRQVSQERHHIVLYELPHIFECRLQDILPETGQCLNCQP